MNNPINRYDSEGEFPHILAGGVVGFIAGASVNLISQAVSGEPIDWGEVIIDGVSGAAYGALVCSGIGGFALAASKISLAGATTIAHGIYNGDSKSQIINDTKVSLSISAVIQSFILTLPPAASSTLSPAMSKLNDYVNIALVRIIRHVGIESTNSVIEE